MMSYTIGRGRCDRNRGVTDFKFQNSEYTATGSGSEYESLKSFMDQVNSWLNKKNINYIWLGEQTSTRGANAVVTYYYTVSICDERSAILFILRWA